MWSENFGAQRFYARYGFEKAGEYLFPVGNTNDLEFILRRARARPDTAACCARVFNHLTFLPADRQAVCMTPRIAAAWHLECPRLGRAAGLRLRARGFQVHAFGYSSVFGGPDVAVPQLLERLADAGPLSLVGHSLGGLLALEALRRNPQLPVQRVVCLGSPLRGSGRTLVVRARLGRWDAAASCCSMACRTGRAGPRLA